jgi:hypothetical protein
MNLPYDTPHQPFLLKLDSTLRVHLDVGIGGVGIELATIPNQASFGIGLQYQIGWLDVMEFLVGI